MTPRIAHHTTVLIPTLQLAVPAAMAEVACLDTAQRRRRATDAVDDMIAHGDDLLYGGRHCRTAFGKVARALAALAFQPDGVDFAGLHWCLSEHPGCPAPAAARVHARLCGREYMGQDGLPNDGATSEVP